MSRHLDVQGAARKLVLLEQDKQVGGRVVGNEVISIECRAGGVGPHKPESRFWSIMGSYWKV